MVMGAKKVFAAGMDGFSGFLNEQGRTSYDETPRKHGEMDLNLKHYQKLQDDQVRFIAQISDYMVAQGMDPLTIITPTDHAKYYQPIESLIKV